jgi:putative restriction endonuclease
MDARDIQVRAAAFDYLERTADPTERTITWEQMKSGFSLEGRRWPLVAPQGIFTPKGMQLPLSILTSPVRENTARKYEDSLSAAGLLVYKYRGVDPEHRDNVGLRACIGAGTPLIYFFGLVKSVYRAIWPVRVLSDDSRNLQFLLSIDEGLSVSPVAGLVADPELAQRSYRTRTVYERAHQESFRRRVLAAYRTECSICRLRHSELLEAAHIIPDSDPRGLPVVRNGMAMCNLHHAAYDANVMGIRPDLVIEIRRDVRDEKDGPMLLHGLQGFHDKRANAPTGSTLAPDKDFLEERFEEFRKTG